MDDVARQDDSLICKSGTHAAPYAFNPGCFKQKEHDMGRSEHLWDKLAETLLHEDRALAIFYAVLREVARGVLPIEKNALTGLPPDGTKGQANFDHKSKSETEMMGFCQAFMRRLAPPIGPDRDMPTGDINALRTGGVFVSGLEIFQNFQGLPRAAENVDDSPKRRKRDIHASVVKEGRTPEGSDYPPGANRAAHRRRTHAFSALNAVA